MADFEEKSSTPNESTTNITIPAEKMSTNPFIVEDQQFVTNFIPPAAVLTMTNDNITVIVMRTAYARIQLRCLYSSINYPQEPPLIELSSPTLPLPLLRNKEREISEKLTKTSLGKAQFAQIYETIYQFIHSNLFVPCWKEMKQIATLMEGKGQLGCDEKEGIIQIILIANKYRANIKLKVPYNYPEEGVNVEFVSSNFPVEIQYMFKSQTEELIRKLEAGFTMEQAFASSSSSVKLPPSITSKNGSGTSSPSTSEKIRLTSDSLKNLKHDVNVLKQISDLRATANSNDSRKYPKELTAEKREARKDLRRLAKLENQKDQELAKQLLEEEQLEMQMLLKATISDTAQPSLFPAAKYLIEEYVFKLVNEKCQACLKNICHEDPENESMKNPKSDKRPMRTFCGHWLHWNCLNDWLTSPPFIRQCPICNRRIWHPDWPEDYKQLEKAWQAKEARKREMSDVSDFMGMGGSAFSK